MHNWQRLFAYLTGAVVFGLLLIVISNNYIKYAAYEGTYGYLVQFAFGLVFLNLNFGISRRFIIKALNMDWFCYLLATLTLLPTLLWTYTKDVGLGDVQLVFVLTIAFAAFLGSYFGIRRGIVKRAQYMQQIRESEDQELPEDLKRPHDRLKKN